MRQRRLLKQLGMKAQLESSTCHGSILETYALIQAVPVVSFTQVKILSGEMAKQVRLWNVNSTKKHCEKTLVRPQNFFHLAPFG